MGERTVEERLRALEKQVGFIEWVRALGQLAIPVVALWIGHKLTASLQYSSAAKEAVALLTSDSAHTRRLAVEAMRILSRDTHAMDSLLEAVALGDSDPHVRLAALRNASAPEVSGVHLSGPGGVQVYFTYHDGEASRFSEHATFGELFENLGHHIEVLKEWEASNPHAMLHGLFVALEDDFSPMLSGAFSEGVPVGLWRKWQGGQLLASWSFDTHGRLIGVSRGFSRG